MTTSAEPQQKQSWVYQTLKRGYYFFTGSPTRRTILNFKYLATYKLYSDLRDVLGDRSGSVLDFGCGTKPYKEWFAGTERYVGVDMYEDPHVDIVVKEGNIPIKDEEGDFDYVLATQVFEHTETLGYLKDLHRLLKPGGEIIITMPFIYHVHEERDFRRLTTQGAQQMLRDYGFETVEVRKQGGIGSTLTVERLYFVDALFRNHIGRVGKILLFPMMLVWYVLLVPLMNAWGFVLDLCDPTGRFYNNVLIIGKK